MTQKHSTRKSISPVEEEAFSETTNSHEGRLSCQEGRAETTAEEEKQPEGSG